MMGPNKTNFNLMMTFIGAAYVTDMDVGVADACLLFV